MTPSFSFETVEFQLQSTDPEAIARAQTVGDLHMKSISTKLNIRQRTDEARTKLEVSGVPDVKIK